MRNGYLGSFMTPSWLVHGRPQGNAIEISQRADKRQLARSIRREQRPL
jgi:hypothetical protein